MVRRRGEMAPGLPLSQQDPHPGLWFGESRPAVSDSSILAAPPEGVRAVGERGSRRRGIRERLIPAEAGW